MRGLISVIIVSCALFATAMTASAASERRSDIPACVELLTNRQAADAMDVEEAVSALRDVERNTRYCSFFGASPGGQRISRSVAVIWGPYTDFRKRASENARKVICSVSKAACKTLDRSLKAKSNLASFAYFSASLDQVGTSKRLPPSAFEGNPAFIWDPGEEWTTTSGLGPTTWVFVYVVESRSLLSVLCGSVADPPTHRCAIVGAKRAYNNITS